MKVAFLSRFGKDIDKIDDQTVKLRIVHIIEQIEQARSIFEIANVKKISGYKNVYRIKAGDYRLGIYYDGETVEFARALHRKDIYKAFP
jgi:mRNA-degrading endonuclease RelE of RelBE toxin-antitoxin system